METENQIAQMNLHARKIEEENNILKDLNIAHKLNLDQLNLQQTNHERLTKQAECVKNFLKIYNELDGSSQNSTAVFKTHAHLNLVSPPTSYSLTQRPNPQNTTARTSQLERLTLNNPLLSPPVYQTREDENKAYSTHTQINDREKLLTDGSWDDVRHILLENNTDILCLSETWLSDQTPDSLLQIPGYNIFRRDYSFNKGGGVAIFIRKEFSANQVTHDLPTHENIEDLWINVQYKKNPSFLIGAMYRHPNGNQNTFNYLDAALNKTINHAKPLYVLGDLNDDQLNSKKSKLKAIITKNGLHQIIENPTRILNIVKNLKNSNSVGHDEISLKYLTSEVTFSYILVIINTSIQTGIFPTQWKEAIVKPLHKSGDTNEPSNFRPVSLLPILSKILEKAVANQLVTFLEENNLLSNCQHAYRKNLSTETALIKVVEEIYEAIENKEISLTVSLDLSKAFDTVDPKTLIDKLNEANIDSFWFDSYLHGRTQSVKINDTVSQSKKVNFGVPQGSILGPILFALKCSASLKNEVQKVQNFAAKVACGHGKKHDHATPFINDLEWLRMDETFRVIEGTFMQLGRILRNGNELTVKDMKTTYGRKSLAYSGPRLFNSLPQCTKELLS
ncbi:unnamed protein product, partial [Rotaria socialis]